MSTWLDVLDLVGHALSTNQQRHAHPRGQAAFKSAISTFRRDGLPANEELRVLLLLVKQGANGLNLTEAQHVILVEPLLDPAVEAQAVGRVHRIGQTKPTYVHRFVVEASVEEQVHQLSSERLAAMDLRAASFRSQTTTERELLTVRDLAFLLKPNWGPEEAGEPQASSAMEAGTPGGQATPDLRALAETAAMARAEAAQTPLQGPPQN
ncbi:hypothetical protein WJX84_007298 [Apatococcus fuscideae]|uniref:Helicase C-terminal domain-containing protein n=1 Tax=Apatococcus fuscideae TaxID=2026836 RepID=A0AAW1SXC0_9CHLO